eukprot:2617064-Rhodomonas_salina.3
MVILSLKGCWRGCSFVKEYNLYDEGDIALANPADEVGMCGGKAGSWQPDGLTDEVSVCVAQRARAWPRRVE